MHAARAAHGLWASVRVALWCMLGTVGRGTGAAFLGALVGVFEAGLVERGR